ncbi:hypothetical protein BDR26DRAFT_861812 [Obelidium mucronatum]|nr:hypothetical protein BDR26DRAFT_861812 [Obelidium mucronatum]
MNVLNLAMLGIVAVVVVANHEPTLATAGSSKPTMISLPEKPNRSVSPPWNMPSQKQSNGAVFTAAGAVLAAKASPTTTTVQETTTIRSSGSENVVPAVASLQIIIPAIVLLVC